MAPPFTALSLGGSWGEAVGATECLLVTFLRTALAAADFVTAVAGLLTFPSGCGVAGGELELGMAATGASSATGSAGVAEDIQNCRSLISTTSKAASSNASAASIRRRCRCSTLIAVEGETGCISGSFSSMNAGPEVARDASCPSMPRIYG